MANLNTPPKYIELYAVCVDDEKPKFKVDNWIRNNGIYRVKYICTEPLNQTEGFAITITDNKGDIIHPTSSMSSFKSSRFNMFEVVLN